MKEKIARIKQLAPNADVRMMSYPTLSDGNKMVCPVRIVANNPVPLRAPLETITTGEKLAEQRDKVISAETGTPIIDLKGRGLDGTAAFINDEIS